MKSRKNTFVIMMGQATILRDMNMDDLLDHLKKMVEKFSIDCFDGKKLSDKQIRQFVQLIIQVKDQNSNNPYARLLYAMLLARRQNRKDAFAEYEKIHEEFPNYEYAYIKHANLYRNSGNDQNSERLMSLYRDVKTNNLNHRNVISVSETKDENEAQVASQENAHFDDLVKFMQTPVVQNTSKKVAFNNDDLWPMAPLPHMVTLFGKKRLMERQMEAVMKKSSLLKK